MSTQTVAPYGKAKHDQTTTKPKIFYVDKKKTEQFKELGLPLEPTMLDLELTRLLTDADQTTLNYTITTLVRKKVGNGEYLFGYQTVLAKDHNGNPLPVVSDVPFGFHEELLPDQIEKGSKGNIIYVNPNANCHTVYDVEFSKELVESMLAETGSDIEKIQISLKVNNKSYAGFSFEEWLNLSSSELVVRNTMNLCGMPVDVSFSSMTGTERLQLAQLKQTKGARK